MARSPDVPAGAVPLRTYAALDHLAREYFKGNLNLLVLVGNPGLSKSFSFKTLAAKHPRISHYIEGKIRPFPTYCELYEHRNKLIICDDAEALWAERDGRYLLRQLTDTGLEKVVKWHTFNPLMKAKKIPSEFVTASSACIIANRFNFGGYAETDAILDRGCLFHFCPSHLEIHLKAAEFFWDATVFDYIARRLNFLGKLSLRTYGTASQLRAAKQDWKGFIESHGLDAAALFVRELHHSDREVAEQVREFERQQYGCRATFFNIRSRLDTAGTVGLAGSSEADTKGKAAGKAGHRSPCSRGSPRRLCESRGGRVRRRRAEFT